MPFTSNKDFKENPRLITEAKGVYLKNHQGQTQIDASSGLFCNPLGHGRQEIIDAVKSISLKVQSGEILSDQIDDNIFSKELYTKNIPDPDLLIRTSGEFRLSNFLLWQSAYTEIFMTETYWPNFREKELIEAIYDYQNRERRFGKVSEQIKL